MIHIQEEDPGTPDAILLLDELSDTLKAITGASGRTSFDPEDVRVARSIFVMARDEEGNAVGCGAFRPIDDATAEVKRMYTRDKGRGVGSLILAYLEEKAKEFGYKALRLETRLVNAQAVSFYASRGYNRIPNFGRYAGRPEAVCFEKEL